MNGQETPTFRGRAFNDRDDCVLADSGILQRHRPTGAYGAGCRRIVRLEADTELQQAGSGWSAPMRDAVPWPGVQADRPESAAAPTSTAAAASDAASDAARATALPRAREGDRHVCRNPRGRHRGAPAVGHREVKGHAGLP